MREIQALCEGAERLERMGRIPANERIGGLWCHNLRVACYRHERSQETLFIVERLAC